MLSKADVVIPVLGKRERYTLLLLLLALFAFVNCQFLAPMIKMYFAEKSELEALKKRVRSLDAIAGSIEFENEAVNAAGRRYQMSKSHFSASMQDGTALFLIGQLATENRVVIQSCRAGIPSDRAHWVEVSLKISVRGDYRDVLAFLEQLEEQFCLNEIVYLDIKPHKNQAAAGALTAETAGETVSTKEQGVVVAELSMLMYSDGSPQGKVEVNEMNLWPVGRGNPFLKSTEYAAQ